MEDIIIPTEHSDLQYSLVVHSDMIFPMYESDNKFNKQIGKLSDEALRQVNALRGDADENAKTKITFNIGGPIFYKSDKRYLIKLNNLQFVDYYSENSFQKLLLDIPDNVVPFLVYKSESNIFDEIRREKGRQASDLISRQFLALSDRKINIQEYFHQSQEDELTTLSIDFSKMENDLMELVA